MTIPPETTSYCPLITSLEGGRFRGHALRHTFRPHGTRDWLLIYTLRGSGIYRMAGRAEPYRSRAHEVTLFRPGTFQDYRADPAAGWDLCYAHFLPRPDWIAWLDWPELAPGCLRLPIPGAELRRAVVRRLDDAARLVSGNGPRREALALNALEEALLRCDTVNPRSGTAAVDPRLQQAARQLSTRLRESFSEERLGRVAGLSPSRLRHLFTTSMGVPPRAFQERQRMVEACRLLALSRHTIAEIAAEVGYENPFYFTLRFKKAMRESPSAFRRRALAMSLPKKGGD